MRLLPAVLGFTLLVSAAQAQPRDVPGDESAGGTFATDTALPFSAEGQGLAGAGLFGRTEDPMRVIENPAFLGTLGRGIRLSGIQTPDLNGISSIDLRSAALTVGTERMVAGTLLTIAAGLTVGDLASEPVSLPGFEEETTNRVTGLAVGVGWEGPVRVRAGIGGRSLVASGTFTTGPSGDETRTVRTSALAADLAADVTLPLGTWILPNRDAGPWLAFDVTAGGAVRGLPLATGYSLTPENDSVEPLRVAPDRSPAVGASALVGVGIGPRARPLLVGSLEGMADEVTYNDDTVHLRGARLTLLETVSVSVGSLNGDSFLPRTTTGVGLSVGGLLRALGTLTDDARLYGFGERFDLRYDLADQRFEDDGDGIFGDAQTQGVTLRYRP